MIRKMSLSVITAACLCATIFADEQNANENAQPQVQTHGGRHNEVDSGYQAEKGWAFYNDPEKQEEQKQQIQIPQITPKNNTEALLQKLLTVQVQQLAVDKKILAILQEQYDPQPVTVTRSDGSKCIANSSADCFVMPVIPEGRRVPVMAAWLKNPNEQTATEYARWQAAYFSHVMDVGSSLDFAIAQGGTNAYPIGFQRPGFDSFDGEYSVVKEKFNKKLLAKHAHDVSFVIFIGKNIDLDIYSMDNISKFMAEVPSNHIELVFMDDASRQVYNDGSKVFKSFQQALRNGNISLSVNSSEFTKYAIQTTPTIAVKFTKDGKKEVKPVLVGRATSEDIIEKSLEFLEYQKVIKRVERADENVWRNSGDYSGQYFKSNYGIDLDKNKIRGYYGK